MGPMPTAEENSPPDRERLELVDAHAHLADAAFGEDLERVLDRARSAGVVSVVAVGETLDEAERVLSLAERFADVVHPCAGLYPTHLDLGQAAALEDWIRERRQRLVGIGEVGLDHWKVQDPEERELQREIFLRFVHLSRELDLPLNVHSRSAGRPTIETLLEVGAERVLMHAFDGRASKAMPAVEAGYFFSVPPSVVRSPQKQKLVRRLPLESLLLETDSPVLGPEAKERNEPANVTVSLRAVAELKERPIEEVAEITTANARRLFG